MSALVERIQEELELAISEDQLDLPTLPEVALQIRDAAEDPNVTAEQLARVIEQDAGLAAQMIRIANSPLYRGSSTFDTLQSAVSRMGVTFAGNVATGMAMKQLFQATTELVDRRLRAIWSRSTQIAATSAVIAKHFTRLRPDQASLAGLTHNIGALPILAWAEQNPGALQDGLTLDRVIDGIHGSLGKTILERWGFPPHLCMVPSQYLDLERKAPEGDYVDLVTVATLQDLAGTSHPLAQVDWSQVQAFQNLGLEPDADSVEYQEYTAEAELAKTAFA